MLSRRERYSDRQRERKGGFSSSSFENRVPYHQCVFDKMAIKF